jgi:hypothetical protein
LGYEPNELPGCSTPLFNYTTPCLWGQWFGRLSECGWIATIDPVAPRANPSRRRAKEVHLYRLETGSSALIGYWPWVQDRNFSDQIASLILSGLEAIAPGTDRPVYIEFVQELPQEIFAADYQEEYR